MLELGNYKEWFENWVYQELLLLVPALYGLGMMLKHMEVINDKFIPVILTVVSVVLSLLVVLSMDGVSAQSVFTGIVQGILCAAVTVYGNQLYKQSTK